MNCFNRKFGAEFNLKFGAEIQARDKMVGHLQKVVVNPETTHVTDLIITQGLIFKRAIVLPLHLVQNVLPEEKVKIALHSDALPGYAHFEEQEIEAGTPQPRGLNQKIEPGFSIYPLDHQPHTGAALYVEKRVIREGVEPDDVLWDEHTAIYGLQGQVGHLSDVVVEAGNGRIQKLVIGQNKLLQKSFLTIPFATVEKSGEKVIHVGLENSDFEELEELTEYARCAPQPAPVNGHSLSTLCGTSPLSLPNSPSLAKTRDLTQELSATLAQDLGTETAVVELIYDRGVVTLAGTVPNQETKERAAALVKQHPDVISVQNSLQVSHLS